MILDYENFLLELDKQVTRYTHARITALTFQEEPIQLIEGSVTSGSINIDGNSVIRRTCNLTLNTQNLDINDYYWGVKTKFKLEIGVENNINSSYPDIIWFPQGIFVIASFSTSQSVNNYTINIQGKDKMCLLNGDLGGSLFASVDFGWMTENGTTKRMTIKEILNYSLKVFAQEPYYNIVINDLDELALDLLEYSGNDPLYLFYNISQESYTNITLNGETEIEKNGEIITLLDLKDEDFLSLSNFSDQKGVEIICGQEKYKISRVKYGDAPGYRVGELVYAGDLILNAGSSLTSLYDKIIKMLGNYEYFYNVDGQFVFQRKKNQITSRWNGGRIENAIFYSSVEYTFQDGQLIQSYQNSPNIQNIKNDFVVWGERIGASGAVLPIHYRYVIDKIPKYYKNYNGEEYTDINYNWREIIYQMSIDYFKNNNKEDFYEKIREHNAEYYPTGRTGYEHYYTDINFYLKDGKLEANIENPETLDFWLDFLDVEGEYSKYSVSAIGLRSKVINDKNVKAIAYKEIPDLIFDDVNSSEDDLDSSLSGAYNIAKIQADLSKMFNISSQGKSAQSVIDDLLYSHLEAAETITLKTLPIYRLSPNTRIYVKNELSKIDGDYIINKISYGLGNNNIMTITASKAPINYLEV